MGEKGFGSAPCMLRGLCDYGKTLHEPYRYMLCVNVVNEDMIKNNQECKEEMSVDEKQASQDIVNVIPIV